MILNIILIVIGIVLVVKGADWLTNGAVSVATKLHISQMVIGLTIVAMGTSMPEFCVSFVSALKGTPDLAVGNVVGSNIFNALLIVGVAAMVAPMSIMKKTVKVDIPVGVVASLLLLILCLDGSISRFDAGAMFLLFLMYMYETVKGAKKGSADDSSSATVYSGWKSAFLIVLGLAALIGGSNVFVEGAKNVAQALGVSDAIIGLTIVAGGTSLPELATSVVSARKGNSGIAIGNVLGSNIFNILMILGVTGLIAPMSYSGITFVDMSVMVISMLLLWMFSFTKYIVARWEGAVLVLIFMFYMVYLVMGAMGHPWFS